MVKIESRCVGCPDRCLGRRCPNREVAVVYCDNCGEIVRECSAMWLTDSDRHETRCEKCRRFVDACERDTENEEEEK